MTPPQPSKLAHWIPDFCCVAPFCTLLLLSIAAICGATIGSTVMFGLICLCGKTTHWVLMPPANVRQDGDKRMPT